MDIWEHYRNFYWSLRASRKQSRLEIWSNHQDVKELQKGSQGPLIKQQLLPVAKQGHYKRNSSSEQGAMDSNETRSITMEFFMSRFWIFAV